MPAGLDRPGLVDAHVARVRRDDPLPGREERVNRDGIRLRAPDKEVDLRLRRAACVADELACVLAVDVRPISGVGLHVCGGQTLEDARVRALLVVGRKRQSLLSGH